MVPYFCYKIVMKLQSLIHPTIGALFNARGNQALRRRGGKMFLTLKRPAFIKAMNDMTYGNSSCRVYSFLQKQIIKFFHRGQRRKRKSSQLREALGY